MDFNAKLIGKMELLLPKLVGEGLALLPVTTEKKTQKNHFGQNPGTPKQKLSGPPSINCYPAHLSPASTLVEATPQTT